jgi:polysaccharide biosynthesis protein PslG
MGIQRYSMVTSATQGRAYRLLLLGLLALYCAEFIPPRRPQPPQVPAARSAVGERPQLGIHTRLAGIGDEALIERTLAQVRDMGAQWIVDLFPWAYVQPRSPSSWDWRGADLIIRHAEAQGLKVIARLDIVPQWARPAGSTDRYLAADHYADFARYAAAFAARYSGHGVSRLIIWNEPNLRFEWGERRPDPAAYAELLRQVYPAVKAAAPQMQVFAGALSPGGTLADDQRVDDMDYLRGLFSSGAAGYFDGWAVHAYGAREAPSAEPAANRVNFRRIELVRRLLDQLGGAHLPMIISEGGYNDHPRWSGAVTSAQRVRWTVGIYAWAQRYDWLEAVALWQFSTPFSTRSYPDNWNFVAPDGTPLAVYEAVRRYSRTEGLPETP